MEIGNDNFKLIAAVAIGAIGGLLLGNYIWGVQNNKGALSKHIATLGKVLEQIEGVDTDEAQDLKGRIQNILKTIESSYVSDKE